MKWNVIVFKSPQELLIEDHGYSENDLSLVKVIWTLKRSIGKLGLFMIIQNIMMIFLSTWEYKIMEKGQMQQF